MIGSKLLLVRVCKVIACLAGLVRLSHWLEASWVGAHLGLLSENAKHLLIGTRFLGNVGAEEPCFAFGVLTSTDWCWHCGAVASSRLSYCEVFRSRVSVQWAYRLLWAEWLLRVWPCVNYCSRVMLWCLDVSCDSCVVHHKLWQN